MCRCLVTACVLVLAACGMSAPPAATALDASRANVALADLQSGRSLLVKKCGGCHRPPMPAEHVAHEWPAKIDEMSKRSNLDVRQRHLIEEYLVTMAAR